MTNKDRIKKILQEAGFAVIEADDWQGLIGVDPQTGNSMIFHYTWNIYRTLRKIRLNRKRYNISHATENYNMTTQELKALKNDAELFREKATTAKKPLADDLKRRAREIEKYFEELEIEEEES